VVFATGQEQPIDTDADAKSAVQRNETEAALEEKMKIISAVMQSATSSVIGKDESSACAQYAEQHQRTVGRYAGFIQLSFLRRPNDTGSYTMTDGKEQDLPVYKKLQRISEMITKGIRWTTEKNSNIKSCRGIMYYIDNNGTMHRLDERHGKKTKRRCLYAKGD